MEFNRQKCAAMCISLKKNVPLRRYTFYGEVLNNVDSHPNLGLQLDAKLRWKEHIQNAN
jgi:hypothetical protein